MAKIIVKTLALTYLLLQSLSFMSAMDNNNNGTDDFVSRLRAHALKIQEQQLRREQEKKEQQSIISQIQNQPDNNQPQPPIMVNLIDNNDKDDISENDDQSNKPHQELQAYKLSDFDYVQDLTQQDLIDSCNEGIFSKDLLWIGKLDEKEFKELQSTGQLQEMILESTIGTDTSENTKHSVIDISNNNDNNNNNESKNENNNLDNEYNIHENETETRECTVCFDELPVSQFITLNCGHKQFCKTCLVDVFKPGLKEKNSKLWKCPANGCTHHLTKSDREKILANEVIHITELSTLTSDEEYTKEEIRDLVKNGAFAQDKSLLEECEELLKRERLLNHPSIKFCPIDYCKAHFYAYFKCKTTCNLCKNTYCSTCLKNHKKDITCEEHERFLNMGNEEKVLENEKWIQQNAKSCPQCKHGIQKDGGCQHMTCKQCRYQFCWVCLGDWNNGNGPCDTRTCGRPQPTNNNNNNNNNNNPVIIEENNDDSDDDSIEDLGNIIRIIARYSQNN